MLSKLKLRQVKESIDGTPDDKKKSNAILKLTKNIQDIAGEQCEELQVVKKPKKKVKKVAVKKVVEDDSKDIAEPKTKDELKKM